VVFGVLLGLLSGPSSSLDRGQALFYSGRPVGGPGRWREGTAIARCFRLCLAGAVGRGVVRRWGHPGSFWFVFHGSGPWAVGWPRGFGVAGRDSPVGVGGGGGSPRACSRVPVSRSSGERCAWAAV